MSDNPRFNIHIVKNHWNCGDGCCSDSGYTSDCYDSEAGTTIYEYDEWDHNGYWGWMKQNILKKIEELIGHPPVENVDYYMSYYNLDTNTQQEYEGYYKDDFEYWEG